jgi:hypothetical protein
MIPAQLIELPKEINDQATHGMLYPNIIKAAWEKHAHDCFEAGRDSAETHISNSLRKALITYDGKPYALAKWLRGFSGNNKNSDG